MRDLESRYPVQQGGNGIMSSSLHVQCIMHASSASDANLVGMFQHTPWDLRAELWIAKRHDVLGS